MTSLLTHEAVRTTRDRLVKSLVPSIRLIHYHLPDKYIYYSYNTFNLYYHTEPSLRSFREKVEHFLVELLSLEEGSSKQYIYYSAVREGSRVKVKALPRRIKSIRTLHSLDLIMPEGTDTSLTPEKKLATAIMDITFLRCLFSLGSERREDDYSNDLSKAALPEDDVRVRIGNYNLLYDKVDKEWSIWMRNSITKPMV